MKELTQNLESVFHKLVSPEELKPHPRNAYIYGEDENMDELVALISRSGWVKPLVVTRSNTIISGHRRWKTVLALRWASVPVEVREFSNELAELEALLLENASRVKTTEQKVREAEAWKDIEAHKARIRQISLAGTRPNSSPDLMENFPQGQKGTTRDRLTKLVGLGSGRTYSKAAKVVTVIDEDIQNGNLASAQGLRKVLNEQSVDAAHTLLKKSPQERQAIANLIGSGKAKSTFQARQMVRQNNYAEFNGPSQGTLAGFSVGDWVEVNNTTVSLTPHAGQCGQVEQILVAEQQISVYLEDGPCKVRFYPHELTLVTKAPPPCPYLVGDLVFVDIDRHEAASAQEKKWNGFWGKIQEIGETGSLSITLGKKSLQLFTRDVKPIDAPSEDLQDVVERVLRLRSFKLDEIEEKLLDVIQRQEWFTARQLDYLDFMDSFYLQTNYRSASRKHAVVPSVL